MKSVICRITIDNYRTKQGDIKQKTWHVQDPGLILPEYLVEFEYITSKSDDSDQSFDSGGISSKEVNRMFQATIESQKLLKNTYINANAKSGPKGTSFHISSEDLDRSDMACIKSVLMKFLKSCHLQELIENNFKFPDEDSSNSKTAIENSLPPDIPNRTKFDEINEDVIKQ